MAMKLVQYRTESDAQKVAMVDGEVAFRLDAGSTYDLVRLALNEGLTLIEAAKRSASSEVVDLKAALAEQRLLCPIHHPDPAHLLISGTGLTHLGSAEGRDKMHKAAATDQETDSMRMFRMGLAGGKPAPGVEGVQPEWFYKGDGSCLVGPDAELEMPAFALDGGEEPEVAGIYVIDDDGDPRRIGFALGNEFSDHVTERGNYLWLAHSKLRPAALGAEILTGPLPSAIVGRSRIERDGQTLWEGPFLTGEDNMSHSIANLEYHHFKNPVFRRPGDVHVHFFGTATLSFSAGIVTRPGDVFEISAEPFTLPLRNRLVRTASPKVDVLPL